MAPHTIASKCASSLALLMYFFILSMSTNNILSIGIGVSCNICKNKYCVYIFTIIIFTNILLLLFLLLFYYLFSITTATKVLLFLSLH